MGRFHRIGEEYTDVESETLKLMIDQACASEQWYQIIFHAFNFAFNGSQPSYNRVDG